MGVGLPAFRVRSPQHPGQDTINNAIYNMSSNTSNSRSKA
jgi:hypothetical protein